jgi:hypothetical protein
LLPVFIPQATGVSPLFGGKLSLPHFQIDDFGCSIILVKKYYDEIW